MSAADFHDALEQHLGAIRARDLDALGATLAGDLVLVQSNGRTVRGSREFLALHRDWFQSDRWSIETSAVETFVAGDLGLAVLRLIYEEPREGGPGIREESVLTLAFRREQGGWRMVFDQNTPCRS